MIHDHVTDGLAFRLREARSAAGLSEQELSFPGCTAVYVCRIERGDRTPSLQVIRRLAERLGVTEQWLALGEDSITVAIDADAIPGIVGYLSDGLGDEYARVVSGDDMVGSGLSPAEWALLPSLLPFLAEDDRQLAKEIIEAVGKEK